jgi:high-affinity iron transporter
MFGSWLIVFREVLEASLVIGIVLAATRGVALRNRWVSMGIGAGVLGAIVVAFFAEAIANALEGLGQEVFNAAVLFLAVVMLGWHNVWMARHGRELATQMKAVGHDVRAGKQPLYALAIVVGLAVLREGSEVVLFLYGIAASGSSGAALFGGGALGVATGAAAGALLYLGLLRIPQKHLFNVTGWMILLLAAGMAAQGAAFLAQAGYLPDLTPALWDTTAWVAQHPIIAQVLKALIGYAARPTGIQLAFYVATLIVIGVCMKLMGRPPQHPHPA